MSRQIVARLVLLLLLTHSATLVFPHNFALSSSTYRVEEPAGLNGRLYCGRNKGKDAQQNLHKLCRLSHSAFCKFALVTTSRRLACKSDFAFSHGETGTRVHTRIASPSVSTDKLVNPSAFSL